PQQSLRPTALVLLCLLAVSGCSNLNKTEQRVLSGAAIGTAIGAGGTVLTGGCVACGAAIGGAVGAGAGYVIDQVEKK
ncbi:MAG: hypothetical protein HGA90_04575, partial [Alphaproteobacteria bacterium]|nr:hypothetical protein [Alphaproteobacteria bacterium]